MLKIISIQRQDIALSKQDNGDPGQDNLLTLNSQNDSTNLRSKSIADSLEKVRKDLQALSKSLELSAKSSWPKKQWTALKTKYTLYHDINTFIQHCQEGQKGLTPSLINTKELSQLANLSINNLKGLVSQNQLNKLKRAVLGVLIRLPLYDSQDPETELDRILELATETPLSHKKEKEIRLMKRLAIHFKTLYLYKNIKTLSLESYPRLLELIEHYPIQNGEFTKWLFVGLFNSGVWSLPSKNLDQMLDILLTKFKSGSLKHSDFKNSYNFIDLLLVHLIKNKTTLKKTGIKKLTQFLRTMPKPSYSIPERERLKTSIKEHSNKLMNGLKEGKTKEKEKEWLDELLQDEFNLVIDEPTLNRINQLIENFNPQQEDIGHFQMQMQKLKIPIHYGKQNISAETFNEFLNSIKEKNLSALEDLVKTLSQS